MIRIGIDIGGTFTDFVVYRPGDGSLSTFKLPSTPNNPAEAVLKGLHCIPDVSDAVIIHGSTVATNALLERKGAKTALITTKGFKDIIQIGRQNRPNLYNWFSDPIPPIVTSEARLEIDERVEHSGLVSKPINLSDIDDLLKVVQSLGSESVAICLLFSFLYPEHEQAIANRFRSAGYFVSSSNEVLPEFREYERTTTTVVNAYVSPRLSDYLTNLENAIPTIPFQVMQSNGGMISIDIARQQGARCILSGPAGGVVGASNLAQNLLHTIDHQADPVKLITFDMGGTSTDVSLIDKLPTLTTQSCIGGVPIALPFLDIHTIGAGGGSIATADKAKVMHVGPESAGANPGPSCYGVGNSPTVTDAHLLLGRILPGHFLGGEIPLDCQRAKTSLQTLGDTLGLDAYQTALGVIEVANAHMERAIRVISVEKGHDPRVFSLFTFGGAGGLHASDLAHRMSIPRIIVPPMASTLSAFGMLAADYVKDYSQTVMLPGDTDLTTFEMIFARLVESGFAALGQEGFTESQITTELTIDIRYAGQSYELNVPWSHHFLGDFARIHQNSYGYHLSNAQTDVVNVRVRVIGKVAKPQLQRKRFSGIDPKTAYIASFPVRYQWGERSTPFYQGELLQPGNRISGPAIIVRSDTTIVLNDQDIAEVDGYQNLIIQL